MLRLAWVFFSSSLEGLPELAQTLILHLTSGKNETGSGSTKLATLRVSGNWLHYSGDWLPLSGYLLHDSGDWLFPVLGSLND